MCVKPGCFSYKAKQASDYYAATLGKTSSDICKKNYGNSMPPVSMGYLGYVPKGTKMLRKIWLDEISEGCTSHRRGLPTASDLAKVRLRQSLLPSFWADCIEIVQEMNN